MPTGDGLTVAIGIGALVLGERLPPGSELADLEKRRARVEQPLDPLSHGQLPKPLETLDVALRAILAHGTLSLAQLGHPLARCRAARVAASAMVSRFGSGAGGAVSRAGFEHNENFTVFTPREDADASFAQQVLDRALSDPRRNDLVRVTPLGQRHIQQGLQPKRFDQRLPICLHGFRIAAKQPGEHGHSGA